MTPFKAAAILSVVLAMVVLVQSSLVNSTSSPPPPSSIPPPKSSTPTPSLSSPPPRPSTPPPPKSSPSSPPPPKSSPSSPPPPKSSPSSPPPPKSSPSSPPPPKSSPSSPPPPKSSPSSPPPPPPGSSTPPPPPPKSSPSSPPPPPPPKSSPSSPPPPPPPKSSPSSPPPPPPRSSTPPPPPPPPRSSTPPSPKSSTPPPPPPPPRSSTTSKPTTTAQQQSTTTQNIKPTSTSSSPGSSAVNGNWAEWGEWTCSVGCANGTKTRTRTCTNPAPSGGGKECGGVSSEKGGACYNKPCAELKIKVSVPIKSMVWEEKLKDTNSSGYKNAKANFESWGRETFEKYKDFKGIVYLTLSQGSVIAEFDVVFSVSSSEQPNYEDAIKTAVNTGQMGNLTVDASKLKTEQSVDGVLLGDWATDRSLCAESCCDSMPSTVYQNRTCQPITSSCWGVGPIAKKIDCGDSGCTKDECNSGITVQISAITMALCVLASLRFFQ